VLFQQQFSGIQKTNDDCIALLKYFLEKYPKLPEEDMELGKVVEHLENMNKVFGMWMIGNAELESRLQALMGKR